jgi:general nucleoside transport system permease protein
MSTYTRAQAETRRFDFQNVKITRTGVFGVFFIIAGILLFLTVPQSVDPSTTTTFTFGEERLGDLVIPVVGMSIVVALLYIVGGAVALLPLPDNLHWLKVALLSLNGVLIVPTLLVLAAAGRGLNITTILASSFLLATPIVIGALAGLWCERSGVANIAIEGQMLTGACIGFVATTLLSPYIAGEGSLWIGVIFAVIAGAMMSLLHAWLSITFMTDQIVSGTVINILAIGLTSFIRREILLSSEAARDTLNVIEIPFLSDIPIVGEVLFTGKPIFLMMFFLIALTHVVLYYTRWGLRTRAVGENPKAADTVGINVYANRYINVIIGGGIAGLAGAWFSLENVGQFDDQMTGGAGFIALAALIFGKWTPIGAALGGLLFGFAQALNARFQILEVAIPPQFIQMIPYIVTIVVLAGLVGRAVAPKADGVPYKKE